jgi:hypothetical protein
MKKESVYSTAVIVMAAILFILYMFGGRSQSSTPSPSPEQQKEVAELKKQIAGLQERLQWLEEKFTEPSVQKPAPL